jgi:hypothetical protein
VDHNASLFRVPLTNPYFHFSHVLKSEVQCLKRRDASPFVTSFDNQQHSFHREHFTAFLPKPNFEDRPFSATYNCLLNILTATADACEPLSTWRLDELNVEFSEGQTGWRRYSE